MQRVANCVLYTNDRVLLLKKPRRGWWVAPGGKMEPGETILETVMREFKEETGLQIIKPKLCGVYTFCVEEVGHRHHEWMMFTFVAHQYKGELLQQSEEGVLDWHPRDVIMDLATAPSDHYILQGALTQSMQIGRFVYTRDEKLINYNLEVL